MDIDFYKLPFSCHGCGEERERDFIKTSEIDVAKEFGIDSGSLYFTIRYCADKKECYEKAYKKKDFLLNKGNKVENETS